MSENKRITKEQILSLPNLLREKTAIEIANEWNVTKQTVHNWITKLRAQGISIQLKPGPRPIINETNIEL